MKQSWGKSRWCYRCNQWQIIIILVIFLSLSTYGIFKLTQDPYRTIIGPVCDLPQPKPEPTEYHYTTYDSIPIRYYYRISRNDSAFIDTLDYWDSTTAGGWR